LAPAEWAKSGAPVTRGSSALAGILALQNDVAQQVAKALAVKLLPAEQARVAGARNLDPEVYDRCLKGSYYTDRLTKADLDTAQRYF
jgi:hypothetical protein